MKLKIKQVKFGYIAMMNNKLCYLIVHNGRYWVAKDIFGDFIDKNQYRHDLFDILKYSLWD